VRAVAGGDLAEVERQLDARVGAGWEEGVPAARDFIAVEDPSAYSDRRSGGTPAGRGPVSWSRLTRFATWGLRTEAVRAGGLNREFAEADLLRDDRPLGAYRLQADE
jgi:hypothetical protein